MCVWLCVLGWVSFFIIGSNDKTSLVIPEKAKKDKKTSMAQNA